MRKQITESKETTKVEEVVIEESVTCNKCGEEHSRNFVEDSQNEHYWESKIQNFGAGFGYGSSYDNERWTFDLCDNCLTEIVKSFKHVPDGFRIDDFYIDEEKHQKIFESWKETGKWEPLLFETYEELLEWNGVYRSEYINTYIKLNYPDKKLVKKR